MAEIALGRKAFDAMDDWPVQYGWWLKHRERSIEQIRADEAGRAAGKTRTGGKETPTMKLMMFAKGQGTTLGLVDGKVVIDLGVADPALPKDLKSLIAAGSGALAAVKAATGKAPASAKLALDAVKPALPIDPPAKIICVGLNYALHAKEGGHAIPTYPSFFLRVPTSLVAAGAPVIRPKVSTQLDYECELTIVIGKKGRHIPEAKALDHVFGYTLFNDVSVRDFQRKTSQWTPGKNFDGTGPLGPWVVTADELPPGASGLQDHDPRQRRDHAGLPTPPT